MGRRKNTQFLGVLILLLPQISRDSPTSPLPQQTKKKGGNILHMATQIKHFHGIN
jgi:hypothetical protein